MADLTIKVDGNLETSIGKLNAAATAGYKQGNISDVKMGQVVKDIERMQEITKKGIVSDAELKELDSAFKRVAKVVDDAAKRAVQITAEAQKKLDTLKKAEDNLSNKMKERQNVRATRTAKITAYGEYAAQLKTDRGISIGNRGKGITKLDTLAKRNIDELSFFKNGAQITDERVIKGVREKLKDLVDAYQKTLNLESKLNGEIEKATNARAKAEDEYNQQIKADVLANKTKNIDFGNQVREATSAMHGDVSSMKDTMSVEKEKQALLTSDVNLSGLSKDSTKLTGSLGKVAKQLSIWTIGFRVARRAMSEVRSTIVDLDKSLTEQAMVTGKTRKEVYGLLQSYQNLAIQLGSTTKEVSAAVTEFIRQGKSTQEALTLAEAAISAAKVASINTSDSINYLTTALNGFQLTTQQAMEVSDKFAAVSANAATSYEEIAIALSKVASQANLAGMSIDYTTALLAKGLETTREAPETIGTALKTIIARMREITDYGETLEDGVDINNVESQLAYVGIQLKTASGELRSTEDVLDDLGRKWDTLNSNQQAAIAKALAGTRQQSRLIAMMSDYERVTELQEISARSAGATMAQMGTYTEGLEAALNRLATSWEKIVSTISNSDVIIGLVDTVTYLLDLANNTLETTGGMIAFVSIIAATATSVLFTKIQEHKVQKLLLQTQIAQRKTELEQLKGERQLYFLTQKEAIVKKKNLAQERLETIENEKQAKIKAAGADTAAIELIKQQYATQEAEQQRIISESDLELKQLATQEVQEMSTINGEIASVMTQQRTLSNSILGTIGKIVPILTTILTIYHAINIAKKTSRMLSKQNSAATIAEGVQEAPTHSMRIFSAFSSAGIPGMIAAAALLTTLGVGISLAIAGANGAFDSQEKKDEKRMQELNNAIYTLTKRSEAIQTTIDKVSDLDEKLIKTKKDAEELASALETIGDKLSGNAEDNLDTNLGNISEQEYYNSLGTTERRKYLEYYQTLLNEQLAADRQVMMDIINRTGIDSTTKRLSARTIAKARGYDILDNNFSYLTSGQSSTLRSIMESVIDASDDATLLKFANDTDYLAASLTKLANVKTADGSLAADVLQDESSSIKERTLAFKQLKDSLGSISSEFQAIQTAYQEFNIFAEWDESVLTLIDDLKITSEELNTLWQSYDTVAKVLKDKGGESGKWTSNFLDVITEDQYQQAMLQTLNNIAENNGNIEQAINEAFGDYLDAFADSGEMYAAIVNQIANTIQIGTQNIGQNVDKLKSSITSMYDVVSKWNSMSYTEQSSFIAEHGELFEGEQGTVLLNALRTQDYANIRQALANNPTLSKNIANARKEIENELNAELAKGINANMAAVEFYRSLLQQITDDDFLSVDLETLVEQENKRIEAYKDLLQQEQDALTKSLEERKDAYQKYFDAINQTAEDEEYEEKAELLVANLTKLSGSTNATSKAKIEELQNSLVELEKERLETLRQRAQEAVIQNIDDSIDEISAKFDELLANNREILNMLNGTSGTDLIAGLLSTDSFAAKTANEAQLYLNELQSTFGNQVSDIDWNSMSVSNTGGNITLNIGDQVIELTGKEAQGRSIKEAIKAALVQIGLNVSM